MKDAQENLINNPILQMMYENMKEVTIHLKNQETLNIQLIEHMKGLEEANKALLTKIKDQQTGFNSRIRSNKSTIVRTYPRSARNKNKNNNNI